MESFEYSEVDELVSTLNILLDNLEIPLEIESPLDLTPSLILAILESTLQTRLPLSTNLRQASTPQAKIEAVKVFLGVLGNDVLQIDLSAVDPRRLAHGEWNEVIYTGKLLIAAAKRSGILSTEAVVDLDEDMSFISQAAQDYPLPDSLELKLAEEELHVFSSSPPLSTSRHSSSPRASISPPSPPSPEPPRQQTSPLSLRHASVLSYLTKRRHSPKPDVSPLSIRSPVTPQPSTKLPERQSTPPTKLNSTYMIYRPSPSPSPTRLKAPVKRSVQPLADQSLEASIFSCQEHHDITGSTANCHCDTFVISTASRAPDSELGLDEESAVYNLTYRVLNTSGRRGSKPAAPNQPPLPSEERKMPRLQTESPISITTSSRRPTSPLEHDRKYNPRPRLSEEFSRLKLQASSRP